MEKKTHWKSAYKSIHLSSADLNGKELTLTVTQVKREEHRQELCNIAYFKEDGYKPMWLNVGNAAIVRDFCGGSIHIEDWRFPIKITIYVNGMVRFGKDTVEGLRIRPKAAAPKKLPELMPNTDKWTAAVTYLKNNGVIDDVRKKYSISKINEQKLLNEAI